MVGVKVKPLKPSLSHFHRSGEILPLQGFGFNRIKPFTCDRWKPPASCFSRCSAKLSITCNWGRPLLCQSTRETVARSHCWLVWSEFDTLKGLLSFKMHFLMSSLHHRVSPVCPRVSPVCPRVSPVCPRCVRRLTKCRSFPPYPLGVLKIIVSAMRTWTIRYRCSDGR